MSLETLGSWMPLLSVLAAAGLAVLAYREVARTYRSGSGRPYGEVVADLYRETERRSDIVKSWASACVQRLDRQERR